MTHFILSHFSIASIGELISLHSSVWLDFNGLSLPEGSNVDCFVDMLHRIMFILIEDVILIFIFQICVVCKQIHGSCTQCSKCSTYYHAMCASRAGYRMEVR